MYFKYGPTVPNRQPKDDIITLYENYLKIKDVIAITLGLIGHGFEFY